MSPLLDMLACLFALGAAIFLWRNPIRFFKEASRIFLSLISFGLFVCLLGDLSQPVMENYPFRMLALCLCFSTTSLAKKRRRYLVLAQSFWFWIEIFGGIALYYRGIDPPWIRIMAILTGALGSCVLSKISRGMEFALMVYWIAIWLFF